MNVNLEKDFYSELGNVPAIPEGIHPQIQARIIRARRRARFVWSSAAIFILCIGFAFFTKMNQVEPVLVDNSFRVERDLQAIQDYFSNEGDSSEIQLDIFNHFALLN